MDDPKALELRPDLIARLREYAEKEGVSGQDALDTLLGLGLEGAEAKGPAERLLDLELGVRDLAAAVDVLGPPVFSLLRLLVAWAAQEGFEISEEELLTELMQSARSEWQLLMAERGILSGVARAGG